MPETGYFYVGVESEQLVDPARILESIKKEMHEMSADKAELVDLGELRHGSDPSLWVGSSSLDARIAAGELTTKEIDEAIEHASKCYIKVSERASKRCVEDRTEEGYDDDDPRHFAALLGPQTQGGTADEALAYRLAHNPQDAESIIDDVRVVSERPSRFNVGAHTDSGANGKKTGCGSIDNLGAKTKMLNDPTAAPVIASKTAALFELSGSEFRSEMFSGLQQASKTLEAKAPDYFAGASKIPKLIRNIKPNAVPKVVGEHKQVALIVNMVPGDTFNTNHYNSHEIYGNLKIHNLDAWSIFEEHDEPEQIALFAQAVATLMRITDGSLRLIIRTPA